MVLSPVHEIWAQEAADERARLLDGLGVVTAGGIVDTIRHVGATSVPGLPASSCIDLALVVWPFPMEVDACSTLESLGYVLCSELSEPDEQHFDHSSGKFRLYISEPGGDVGLRHLVLREYLRHNEDARTRYAGQLDVKDGRMAELAVAAGAWWIGHHGFGPMEAIVGEMSGYARPWYISSGWAIDLFLGRVTRLHHDVDVVVGRGDQLALRAYLDGRGWQYVTPLKGKLEPWPVHTQIELPAIRFTPIVARR